MDFTLTKYRELLIALKKSGVSFALRHDVDKCPERSLQTAMVEHELGLVATYYFRIVSCSNVPAVICAIQNLGHEIGYHYEDLTLADGDVAKAYGLFIEHLAYFRTFCPVTKICMHGSPRSPYDSKDIWKQYDYHALGVDYEPYLDEDYTKTFYLTDTGRCWDGYKVSVRDKIPVHQDRWNAQGLVFHSTDDVIRALNNKNAQLMAYNMLITTHPQRWTDNRVAWLRELILQNAKNIVKRLIAK